MTATSIALVVVVDELDESNAVYGAVQNFIDVYEAEVDRIAIIGPQRIDLDRRIVDPIPVRWPSTSYPLSRAVNFLRYQVRVAKTLRRERAQFDLVFFHVGGSMLFVPMLASHFSEFRSGVFITGSPEEGIYARRGRGMAPKTVASAMKAARCSTCFLADTVILLSESMELPPIRWPASPEIRVANFNFVDRDLFDKRTAIEKRTVDIVFLGRLEHVKGVMNIARALPGLVDRYPNLRVTFIGAGNQLDELREFIERHGLDDHVTFIGWIDRAEIPSRLDAARTLLLPSASEGVPKTLLEAMSCGTVPVATSVGGVPDIIDDGTNGFLLEDADPRTIERTVSTVLDREDLDEISNNACSFIDDHHSYASVKEQYRDLLHEFAPS